VVSFPPVPDVEGLIRTAAELRTANQAKDELLGLVSHELRNPLATILAAVRRLSVPGFVVPEERETLDVLVRNAARLAVLLDDMLVLAHDNRPVELEPVLLQRIIPAVIAGHRARFPGRCIVVDVPDDLPIAAGHPGWTHQVIENLLSNAEKYSPPETVITVCSRPTIDGVSVRVLDRGVGIPAARSHELFEPFHREESARAVQGLGLGLTVCKRLVELQSGRLWAAPRPGGGSEFGFLLRPAE
jgi:signal transduction histidine kinase